MLQFPIVKSGTSYGYKTSKTGTFVAFRGDSTDTYTYASGSTGGTVDLGARNTYRYINASNVYNKGKSDGVTTHTGTYTFPSNDTGGTKDLGVNHSYRYVNATNVYNKGKSDGSTELSYRASGIFGGSANFLEYINNFPICNTFYNMNSGVQTSGLFFTRFEYVPTSSNFNINRSWFYNIYLDGTLYTSSTWSCSYYDGSTHTWTAKIRIRLN